MFISSLDTLHYPKGFLYPGFLPWCTRKVGSLVGLENECKIFLNGGSSSQQMDCEPKGDWEGGFPWSWAAQLLDFPLTAPAKLCVVLLVSGLPASASACQCAFQLMCSSGHPATCAFFC